MKYIFRFYVLTVVIATICFWFWGEYSYRGFFANLGRGVVWPAIVFPTVGKIVSGLVLGAVILFILVTGKSRSGS